MNAKKWLLVFLGIYAVVSVLLFDPKPDTGGDNAVYVILAKSIKEGKGYTNLYLPDETPHTLYPFGFPVLLSLLFMVSGISVISAKVLVMLTGIGAMFFIYKIIGHLFKDRGLIVMGFLLSIPVLIMSNHRILTEIPFLGISMAGIYVLLKATSGHRAYYWFGCVLAVLAFVFRTAGIALVFGVIVFLLLKKQYKCLGFLLLLFLVAFVPWQIRNMGLGHGQTYFDFVLARDPYVADFGRIGLFDLIARIGHNFTRYCFDILPRSLVPMLKNSLAAGIAGFSFLVLVIIGFIRRIRHKSVIEAYAVFSVLMVLGWPKVWTGERFLIPVLPILVIYVFIGLLWLKEKLGWRHLVPFVAGFLILVNVIEVAKLARVSIRDNIGFLKGNRYCGCSPGWMRYFEASDWIGANIPNDKVILARKPGFVYLVSGHKSLCYPFTNERAEVRNAIDVSDYILLDNFRWTETARYFLIPVMQENPGRYQTVHETGSPRTYVIRIEK